MHAITSRVPTLIRVAGTAASMKLCSCVFFGDSRRFMDQDHLARNVLDPEVEWFRRRRKRKWYSPTYCGFFHYKWTWSRHGPTRTGSHRQAHTHYSLLHTLADTHTHTLALTHTHRHTHTHTHTHTHNPARSHTHTHTHTHTHAHTHTLQHNMCYLFQYLQAPIARGQRQHCFFHFQRTAQCRMLTQKAIFRCGLQLLSMHSFWSNLDTLKEQTLLSNVAYIVNYGNTSSRNRYDLYYAASSFCFNINLRWSYERESWSNNFCCLYTVSYLNQYMMQSLHRTVTKLCN